METARKKLAKEEKRSDHEQVIYDGYVVEEPVDQLEEDLEFLRDADVMDAFTTERLPE